MKINGEIKIPLSNFDKNQLKNIKEAVDQGGDRTGKMDLLTKHCKHPELDEVMVRTVSEKVVAAIMNKTGLINGVYGLNCPVCRMKHEVQVKEFAN